MNEMDRADEEADYLSSEEAYERLENDNDSDRSDQAEDYALSHERSKSNREWLDRGGIMDEDNDEGGIENFNEDNEVNTDNEGDIDQMMDVDEGG
jgi:hypothetical protein